MSSEAKDGLSERGPGVFEPDSLLPSQYFDRVRRHAGHGGEWALMVAILEDAVNVYLKHAAAREQHNRRLFDEAEEWIEAHEPTYIFSFENICDLLGTDPGYVRRGLRAAKARARDAKSGESRSVTITVGSASDAGSRRGFQREPQREPHGESDDTGIRHASGA
jgi:hypothetical protein